MGNQHVKVFQILILILICLYTYSLSIENEKEESLMEMNEDDKVYEILIRIIKY